MLNSIPLHLRVNISEPYLPLKLKSISLKQAISKTKKDEILTHHRY